MILLLIFISLNTNRSTNISWEMSDDLKNIPGPGMLSVLDKNMHSDWDLIRIFEISPEKIWKNDSLKFVCF